MTTAEIEAFLAVAEYRNLTRAADSVFISQPALSKRIEALEQALGVSLINRKKGNRNVVLTREGKAFINIANRYMSLQDEALLLKSTSKKIKLTVLSSDGPHLYVLPDVYREMMNKYPEISFKLSVDDYRECYKKLQQFEGDLAFVGSNFYFQHIISVPAYSEKMCFICRRDSDYPDTIYPENLSLDEAVFSPYSSDYVNWFRSLFGAGALPLLEAHLISQVEDFMLNYERNVWSIVPTSVMNRFAKNPLLVEKKIVQGPPERIIYMARRVGKQSEYVNAFIETLKEEICKMPNITLLLPDTAGR